MASRSIISRLPLVAGRLLLAALFALAATAALAQSSDESRGEPTERLVTPGAHPRPSRGSYARPARVATGQDSVWVGHSIQIQNPLDHTTFSYGPFHVGRGNNRPKTGGSAADNSGLWDWDHFQAGESDSLQGWWPLRRVYTITGGLTLPDDQRPWWAVDIGNQGNYVLDGANGRTRGVLGYWHVDGGTDYTMHAKTTIAGTNPGDPGFAPLDGHGSAWCGLRGHGDQTYLDPITGNPYDAMVMELNGENGGGTTSGVGTNKQFPGYPSQMDQMLYRDVEMTSAGATLNLSFLYRTAMSTSATTTASTRAGWFQFDPTVVGPVAVAGPNAGIPNYVANTGIGQPADSFMVYVGVPVDINRGAGDGSDDVWLADGSHQLPGGAQAHGVYDLKRRWFSEVLRLDMPILEVLHVSGNVTSSFSLPGQALAAFYAPQAGNAHQYLRIVFRVKTNRGFDDMTGSVVGSFNSGGVGAALVDDVAIGGTGLSGGALGTSTFESPGAIDNGAATDNLALGAWKATGKPPAIFFHAHPLPGGDIGGGNVYAPLTYQDICGPPGSPIRICNMAGVVISAGDHDHGEAAGGLVAGTPERERSDGMLSPTILLASSGTGDYNACGLDHDDAVVFDDYYVQYDIYTGIFNLFFTGNMWQHGFQSYPGAQSDGTKCWGEIRYPGAVFFNPSISCFTDIEPAKGFGLIRTTNVGMTPDSMRIYLGKTQECFRFGVTGSACSPTAGAYFDNVSLLLSDAIGTFTGGPFITTDIWQWINDTFPANDGASPAPGVAVAPGTAAFDTTAAYIKTGFNIAAPSNDASRFDIPGDSVVVTSDATDVTTNLMRVDMVFRIKPGVGNYVTIGDPTSGLRRVPTSTDPAIAGVYVSDPAHPEKDFWSAYMADPGEMSKGVHGPGSFWNKNVWNSARIDTAEINLFPIICQSQFCNIDFSLPPWMATYHEDDPKYSLLGITHNRCFLINPAGLTNSTNITCSSVPTPYLAPGTGYDGNPTTKEGTKIIPDGLLTPGAHVEYFFRAQAGIPVNPVFVMSPETTFVTPQRTESSTDGHRWQEFSVLPDRWKDTNFGGTGMACMLYVDWADSRGDERVWVSVADSLGLTGASQRGAHNGWRAACNGCLTDAAGNPIDVSANPAIARYDHGGQPGTAWDMYGVKGAESVANSAGQLGSRMGPQATGLAAGKDSKQGPTPAMLRAYYKALLILTWDLGSAILGPCVNRGQNDVALLEDYLSNPAPGGPSTQRAIVIGGSGFVQSEYATGSAGSFPSHLSLLTDYLGVTIKKDGAGNPQYSYQPWSGNTNLYENLTTTPPLPSNAYSLDNSCISGPDVLDPVVNGLNAQPSAYYQNVGANGPYVASVYTPVQAGKFYESFVDGWGTQHLLGLGGGSSLGRLGYFFEAMSQVLPPLGCSLSPIVALDVPGGGRTPLVDFMQVRNNPDRSGPAIVHLGLAKPDHVTARIYDVSGRLVRTLADRLFPAGEHDLAWDGADDHGHVMRWGVYFAELRYAASGFRQAKKLIVLK